MKGPDLSRVSRKYQHLRAPADGRIFIVGDLHGCRAALMSALNHVQFDFSKDILISTGDLVDRGADSLACLRLLREPWFFAVKGNHDEMLLAHLGKAVGLRLRVQAHLYSGQWLPGLNAQERVELESLAPLVDALPSVIEVENGDASTGVDRFFVLHAERRLRGGFIPNADLRNDAVLGARFVSMTWGRRLFREMLEVQKEPSKYTSFAEGGLEVMERALEPEIALTYVGHSIVEHPVLYRSHVFIDGGAYRANAPWREARNLFLLEHRPYEWPKVAYPSPSR
jgi:serine/threonine protein phosphatase 1